jgi:hypothetical protein
MSSMVTAWLVFGCAFASALIGTWLRTALPEHHLSTDTKDVVKVAIALVATMGALVLGLLISSAKSAYDTRNSQLVQISVDLVRIDRVLARYGPETSDARADLRRQTAAAIQRYWPSSSDRSVPFDRAAPDAADALYDKIDALAGQTAAQRALRSEALTIAQDIARTGFFLIEQAHSSVPTAFLVVLIFWLSVIFLSFGLFAPLNATVLGTLLVCALSVGSALFLIMELDRSFEGLIEVSAAPLRQALAHLGP